MNNFDLWKQKLDELFESNKSEIARHFNIEPCAVQHWYRTKYIPLPRQLQLVCRYPAVFTLDMIDDSKTPGVAEDLQNYLSRAA